MKTAQTLFVTAFLAGAVPCTTAALAQVCSGGPEGGTDATGNQCSTTTQAATEIDDALWALISSRRVHPTQPPTGAQTPASPAFPGSPPAVSTPSLPAPGAGDIRSSRWAAR